MGSAAVQSAVQRRTLGLALLLLTAAIWIAASFISEALVTPSDSQQQATVHPFLLTYLATSLFTIYLPLLALRPRAASDSQAKREGTAGRFDDVDVAPNSPRQSLPFTGLSPSADRAAMQAALWALPLWSVAQYTFNTSLALTSVTSNTILSSSSSLFTFFLSVLFLNEKFTARKLLSILACIVGTALVTLSDAKSNDNVRSSVVGDVLTVLSSCVYAGYTVVLRKKMPADAEEATAVAAFFGYLGLFSTVGAMDSQAYGRLSGRGTDAGRGRFWRRVLLAPLVVLLLALGVFSFSTIPPAVYLVILVEGLVAYLLADYLWARAILLLGPTTATLGMSVQIPMAATVELLWGRAYWIHHALTVLMTLVGTVCIVGGFVTLASHTDDAAKDAAGDDLRTDGLLATDGGDVFDVDEKLGLLAANLDNEVAGGAQEFSAGHEGTTRESWARSVLGKLGRGKSNRSSSDSNVELRHST